MFTNLLKKSILYVTMAAIAITSVSCSDSDNAEENPGPIINASVKAKINNAEVSFGGAAASVEDSELVFATSGGTATVGFIVPAVLGTYEYVANDDENEQGYYITYIKDGKIWISEFEGGHVKVTITKLDRAANKVSGTFSGTVLSLEDDMAVTITNGTFTDVALIKD
ncbi:DUF6252 family protein [Pontibacter sp. SGAir0037]|uniref:DUF6252 family protein n=1 Tax=Pontibacter sp. SGAir0037 TaxID=2571030 RepID=UPI0010CCD51E|nr:DUF6252 family protein [Pontibacter sp. SGAir0037]QCR23319.1 hypothetical protein C1N53_13875 [Pontibacter sp. SGAir0037]